MVLILITVYKLAGKSRGIVKKFIKVSFPLEVGLSCVSS